MDFEKVAEFIEKVKKYDSLLEDECGEQAIEVKEKINEISSLVQTLEMENETDDKIANW